jgi:hypothetical protein
MRRFLTLVVIALVAALAPATSAAGAVTGTLTTHDDVAYGSCHDVPYDYQLVLAPGTTSWVMTVDVFGPDAALATEGHLSGDGTQASGSSSFELCSFNGPGTYTLRASGQSNDASSSTDPFTLPDATLTIRAARSRTTLTTPNHDLTLGHLFTLTVTVRDERPAGYAGTPFAEVAIQRRDHGAWTNLPPRYYRTETNRHGVATIRARWHTHHPLVVRARTLRDGGLEGSASAPLTLR